MFALGELDWETAQKRVREMEAAADDPKIDEVRISLADASEKFLTDAEARQLSEATIYKYTLLFKRLKEFAQSRGIKFLDELDVDTLGAFRSSWKLGPLASLKHLERLRSFFKFAQDRKWIADSPVRGLKAPKLLLVRLCRSRVRK